jgi:hypothetical protein
VFVLKKTTNTMRYTFLPFIFLGFMLLFSVNENLSNTTFKTNEFATNVVNPIAMVKNEADNIKEKSELLFRYPN